MLRTTGASLSPPSLQDGTKNGNSELVDEDSW